MTIEEAIKNRERCLRYLEGCAVGTDKEGVEAVRLSLAALREKAERENPKPMTLDELRQMDGEPAYFVSLRDGFSAWGIVRVVNMSQTWFIAVAGSERAFGERDSYGTEWIGYRSKPKEDK